MEQKDVNLEPSVVVSLTKLEPNDCPKTQDNDQKEHKTIGYILSRFVCLCASFNMTFSAYYSIESLQSSINPEAGLGAITFGIFCVIIGIGCAFSSAIIQCFSVKAALFAGSIGMFVYVLLNMHSSYISLIAGSVIAGVPSGAHVVAIVLVLVYLSKQYAAVSRTQVGVVTQIFNGFLQASLCLSKPFGLTITSIILADIVQDNKLKNVTSFSSEYIDTPEENNETVCGSNHCPYMKEHIDVLLLPSKAQVYLIFSCLASLVFVSIILIYFLPKVPYKPTHTVGKEVLSLLRLHISLPVVFLIPSFILLGATEAMLSGTFYSSFVSCYVGLGLVSPVVICEGCCSAVFALLTGYTLRFIDGFSQIALTSFLLGLMTIVCVVVNPSSLWALFLLAGLQGAFIGIIKVSLIPIITKEFPNTQALVLSLYYVYQYVIKGVVFSYSAVLCYKAKAYIFIVLCATSFISMMFQKYRINKREKTKCTNSI